MGDWTSRDERIPPSLSDAKSEFQKFCGELGGPADIGINLDKTYLEQCCRDYSTRRVLPVLLRFQKKKDDVSACRHWPWAAAAITQYVFETKKRQTYGKEPTANEVSELILAVADSAHGLGSALYRLQDLANRLRDLTDNRRGHLAWLDAYLAQALAGRMSNELKEDGVEELENDFSKAAFLKQLGHIELGAKEAAKRVDPQLLERERGQTNPALPNFVWRCAKIWTSLTGRKPSANKVEKSGNDSTTPDFVLFIQELATLAGGPVPTLKQVGTALRKASTPD